MLTIRFSGSTASEEQITEFEDRIGVRLPNSYRQFLEEYNGGKPDPNYFIVERSGPKSECMVDWFLSLGGVDLYDVNDNLVALEGRIPSDCVPIAIDPGGNFLILSVWGERRDSIFFWDHELENGESTIFEENIFYVCTGFDNFLLSLYCDDTG